MRRLTVSLAAGLAVCLAAASGFGATTIDQIRVRGDNTSAEFDLFNPFTCADGVSSGGLATQILVFAFSSANKTSGPPTTSKQLEVVLFSTDTCTGETHAAFSNTQNPDFQQNAVNHATLNADVTLQDNDTGAPLGTVHLALAFDGSGDVLRTHEHNHTQFGRSMVNETLDVQMRSATLSGAATFNGVNLLPFAQNVDLQTQSTGELQLTRM